MVIIIENREIFYDSLKYPSTDWLKVIILGVLVMLPLIGLLSTLTFASPLLLLFGFLPLGYLFRIIESFISGSDELPDLDDWILMATDGFKVALVGTIYVIPLIILSLIFIILQGTLNSFFISGFNLWSFLAGSPLQLILFILIGLIESIAIANMALYKGEISAAFRFSEILERISMIGWDKYLLWYISVLLIGLICVLISIFAMMIIIGIILVPLLIIPYTAMLITRSLALIFVSSESYES
jgi:Protein of unknown function (DUF4013)